MPKAIEENSGKKASQPNNQKTERIALKLFAL